MTIQELIDNINALGIGVGSDAEDVLERDLATDVRLPALINRGVADLYKVRPRRGAVVVDLAAEMESDGTVNVYNALPHTTPEEKAERDRFSRLDGFSVAEEDAQLYGIMRNAWTSDRLLHIGAMPYVKLVQAENKSVQRTLEIVKSWNGTEYKVVERGTKADRYASSALTVYLDKKENTTPAEADTNGRSVVLYARGTTPDETYYQLVEPKQLPVTITYRKKPVDVTVHELSNNGSENFEIDLDDDLADILPSYVASYLYLEENEGKAKYYRSIYETRRSEIASSEYNRPEASRTVYTNGW